MAGSRKIKDAHVAGRQPARGGLLRRRTGGRGRFILEVCILRWLFNIHRERWKGHLARY